MASDDELSNDRVRASSLNLREPRQAKRNRGLSLAEVPRKAAGEQRSSDPYNTSGSFDRTKNWARIGKR
jgi:hypothetical protein